MSSTLSLFFSFHSQIILCSDEEYVAIAEIAKMYLKVSCEKNDAIVPCMSTDGNKWTLDTGTAVFSDLHTHLDR